MKIDLKTIQAAIIMILKSSNILGRHRSFEKVDAKRNEVCKDIIR